MPKSGFQANLRRAQTSNEPTQGELELPEAAALVFLGDDPATGGQKVNSMKSLGSFTAEYFDKRSQAKYVSFFACLQSIGTRCADAEPT